MRAINLLPRDEKRPRAAGTLVPLFAGAAGLAAVTGVAVALTLSASGVADERRTELAAAEAALARLPKALRPEVTQAALVQERSDRVAALSAALSTRIAFDRLFQEISLVLPEDTWLTGIVAAAPAGLTSAASPGGGGPSARSSPESVTIQGSTYSHDAVARVLSRLSVVPSLENVQLRASALVELQATKALSGQDPAQTANATRKPVVTFTISASLRTGVTP